MPKNKVAVVTGAARRIGAALVHTLHQRGFNVLIHYNQSKQEALALSADCNTKRGDSTRAFQANLEDEDSANRIYHAVRETWGRCDLLINNASAYFPTPFATASEADWDSIMASNLKSPFFLSQQLAPMLADGNGTIINIADAIALRAKKQYSIYRIAKAGNFMLTKSLAFELAPEVRVNGIAPGAMLWPEDQSGAEKIAPDKIESIPLKRLGGTEPLCQAVLFLVENADYISGEILHVDGGLGLSG